MRKIARHLRACIDKQPIDRDDFPVGEARRGEARRFDALRNAGSLLLARFGEVTPGMPSREFEVKAARRPKAR